MSQAGLPVIFQVEGAPRLLPPGIELTLYRVAQEALTNTLKHAGPATAWVMLHYGEHAVDLDVLDNGLSPGAPGTGHGLIGMRERVTLYGGSPGGRSVPAGRFRGAGSASGGRCGAMIRVLLADDQALVRGGFRSILDGQDDIDVVGEACDGVEALDQAISSNPDVILMDIRMPRLDGIEATRRLLSGGRAHARVLILTTFDHDEYVSEALRAGASGVPAQERATARARERDPDRGRGRGTARSRDHPPDDRGIRPPPPARRWQAAWPGDAHQPGTGGPGPDRAGSLQRRNRRHAIPERTDHQDPRNPHPGQAAAPGPVQAVVLAYECGLIQPGAS